jgi:hypothetical protein
VIEDVLRTATDLAAAAGGTRTILVAWVDHRNLPSRRLLCRSGLPSDLRGTSPAFHRGVALFFE